MSKCNECNWFSTREEYCSKKHYKVTPQTEACDDEFWSIVRPTIEEEMKEYKTLEQQIQELWKSRGMDIEKLKFHMEGDKGIWEIIVDIRQELKRC